MRKKKRSDRRSKKPTARHNEDEKALKILELYGKVRSDERKEQWHRQNPDGATVHLFVSDEHPTAENAESLYLIEPWECEEYEPRKFNFGKVEFPFNKGSEVKAYGYFIRHNATGKTMFLERFKGAPFHLEARYGGSISIDCSTLTWN